MPPLAEVAFIEVEDDRDVMADGEALDLRRGDGHNVISSSEESEWTEWGAIWALVRKWRQRDFLGPKKKKERLIPCRIRVINWTPFIDHV